MKEWQHLWDKPVWDEMERERERKREREREREACIPEQEASIRMQDVEVRPGVFGFFKMTGSSCCDGQTLWTWLNCIWILIIVLACAHACLLLTTESDLSKSHHRWLRLHPLSAWSAAQAKFKLHGLDHHQNTAAAAWGSEHLWVTQQDLEKSNSHIDYCNHCLLVSGKLE